MTGKLLHVKIHWTFRVIYNLTSFIKENTRKPTKNKYANKHSTPEFGKNNRATPKKKRD